MPRSELRALQFVPKSNTVNSVEWRNATPRGRRGEVGAAVAPSRRHAGRDATRAPQGRNRRSSKRFRGAARPGIGSL